MMSTGSDPVADSYDGSRAWPVSAMEGFLSGLEYLLVDGPALEVGVGRGRIAHPLRQRNVQVTGIDIVARELDRLARQTALEGISELDLVQGDAISLPFAGAVFNGVYTVNVFHLVKAWEQALAEIQRVLKPGGLYINGTTNEVATDISNHMEVGWETILKRNNLEIEVRPGVRSRALFDAALRDRGAQLEVVPVCRWVEAYSSRQRLERMSVRLSNAKLRIPNTLFSKCIVDYERWLKAQYGELDARLDLVREAALHIWRWP